MALTRDNAAARIRSDKDKDDIIYLVELIVDAIRKEHRQLGGEHAFSPSDIVCALYMVIEQQVQDVLDATMRDKVVIDLNVILDEMKGYQDQVVERLSRRGMV